MNNKKIFSSAILCAAMIMIFMIQIVSAAGGFVVDITDIYNDEITISGSSDSTNEGDAITILVLNPDCTIGQAKTNPAAIQHQWVVSAGADGEFSHTFRLNLSDSFEKDTFNIYVGGKTFGAIASEPYFYRSFAKALIYAKKIHADFTDDDIMGDEEKKAAAVAYFEKAADLLGFHNAFGEVDADKVADSISAVFKENPIDFTDGEKGVALLVKAVDLHSVLEAFRNGKSSVLFDKDGGIIVDEIVGLSKAIKDNTTLKISDINSNGVSFVNSGIMVPDIEDEEHLAKLYAKNIILQSLKNNNDLGYDFVDELLTEQNTAYAGLSVADYIALSDKSAANTSIIANKDSLTLDNLASKINEYAKEVGESGDKPEPPSKGNTGGGGATGGKVTVTEPVETKPEEEVKPAPEVPAQVFTDLSGYAWAKEAVETLFADGIISGMGDGTFAPGGNLTREQAIKIIVLALGLESKDTDTGAFADEKQDAWYSEYLAIAREHGIANGIGDNMFGVGKTISRQDFVTMLYRALKLEAEVAELTFADSDAIKSYSKDAVAYFSTNGIVNGYTDGTFKPDNLVKRAEAAKIVYELLKGRDA